MLCLSALENQVADLLSLDIAIPQSRVFGINTCPTENETITAGTSIDIAGPSIDIAGPSIAEQNVSALNTEVEEMLPNNNKKRRFESTEFRNEQIQTQTHLLGQTNKYLKRMSDQVEKFVKSNETLMEAKLREIDLRCEILALQKQKLEAELETGED